MMRAAHSTSANSQLAYKDWQVFQAAQISRKPSCQPKTREISAQAVHTIHMRHLKLLTAIPNLFGNLSRHTWHSDKRAMETHKLVTAPC
eukprot:scaffold89353_cov35-Prasinocladus_malaysianus.AAC.1